MTTELNALTSRLIRAADDIRNARTSLNAANARAARVTRDAYAAGATEVAIAAALGVNRLTVRRWLGK